MKPKDLEALVIHRLQKSEEALQAAKIMLDKKFDYVDFVSPDQPMVAEYLETAKKVVSQITLYLNKD
jgi:hypothetical protein